MELNIAQRLFPTQFSFWPETFRLPEERAGLERALTNGNVPGVKTKRKNHQKPPSPKTTFILKPDDSSQGDGIFLVQKTRDLRHLDAARKIIAQHYIAEPILCDGFKFDLRIYVVVSSVTPLRAHVCREGLVRLATKKYISPTSKNLSITSMHLTNYSLNKRSKDFDHGQECSGHTNKWDDGACALSFNSGSKRSMLAVLSSLADMGKLQNPEATWTSICSLVRHTLLVMHPHLKASARSAAQANGGKVEFNKGKCFQIFGFDVVLDKTGAPFLLEVNSNPSMCIDAVHDLDKEEKDGSAASARTEEARVSYAETHIRRQRSGAVCRCMDSHKPHRHAISPVDLAIKSVVLRGALQLVLPSQSDKHENIEKGGESKYSRDCSDKEEDSNYDNLFDDGRVPCDVEQFFGNVARVFDAVVGSRKLDAFKWRKFALRLLAAQKKDEDKVEKEEGVDRNILARSADSLFRKHSQFAAEDGPGSSGSGTAFFLALLVEWAEKHLLGESPGARGELGSVLARALRNMR
jgi:hypothetical protein